MNKQKYIDCDWAEIRCGICDYHASSFDETMQKDLAWIGATHMVMYQHKKDTGHDQWRNIPKYGAMPAHQFKEENKP